MQATIRHAQPLAAAKHMLLVGAGLLVVLSGCQSVPAPSQMFRPVEARFQDSAIGDPVGSAQNPLQQALLKPTVQDDESPARNSSDLVADVRIVGNKTVPTHHILRNIRTRKGRYFDPDLLQQDIDSLWKIKEFRRINGPFIDRTSEGIVVTIEVTERKIIKSLRFVGNRAFTDRQLKKQVDLAEGQPLDVQQIRMARQQLEDYYHQQGYPLTQVELVAGDATDDEAVAFLINEDSKERVFAVEFEGNHFVSAARLRSFVKAKPSLGNTLKGFAVDRNQIEQDVLQLTLYYRSFGFFNARIGREIIDDPDSNWIRIRYVIDEGPRYRVRNVSFIGNRQYSAEQLLSALKLKTDQGDSPEFNAASMNTDLNSLRDLYGSEGFVFANVELETRFLDEPGMLDLVYKIDEGKQYRVGQIHVRIDGEPGITKRAVALNPLTLQPGDVIDIRKIRNSERHLNALQVFADGSPGTGQRPRIVVKPAEFKDLERYAESQASYQSP